MSRQDQNQDQNDYSTLTSATNHPAFPTFEQTISIARFRLASHKQAWHTLELTELEDDTKKIYEPDGLKKVEYAHSRFRVLMLLHLGKWSEIGISQVLNETFIPFHDFYFDLALKDFKSVVAQEDLVSALFLFVCLDKKTPTTEMILRCVINI